MTLTVVASGEPLRYQWQHNGTNLAAETNASLTIRNIDVSRVGNYAVYVSNPHGYNYVATMVTFSPPGTIQPESRTVYRGEMVLLSVTASGVAPFAYQWVRDDAPMVNETNATTVVPTFSREDSSTYHATTTDSAGNTVTSRNATVTIIDPRPASVTRHPVLDTSIHSSGTNPRGTSTILSGTRRNGILDRGLLRFDLSSIATNAIVNEASVQLLLFRDR